MRKRLALFLLVSLVPLTTLGLGHAYLSNDEDWPMLGHDPSHSWATSEKVTPPLLVEWIANLTTLDESSPAVRENWIFVGTQGDTQSNAKVYGLERETGQVRWIHDTGARTIASSPAVSNGLVYIGVSDFGFPPSRSASPVNFSTGSGALLALDETTGTLVWSMRTLHSITTSPVVEDGLVYTVLDGEGVLALDGLTGEVKWVYPVTAHRATEEPILYDGSIYVALLGQGIAALDAHTGSPKWWIGLAEGQPEGGLTAGLGMLFATLGNFSADGDRYRVWLAAFTTDTGRLLWKRLLYDLPFSKNATGPSPAGRVYPALANETIIATGMYAYPSEEASRVFALDARSGTIRWSSPIFEPRRRVAVAASLVFVVGSEQMPDAQLGQSVISALDLSTGTSIWSYRFEGSVTGSGPVVGRSGLYVGAWLVGLYAFAEPTEIPEFAAIQFGVVLSSALLLAWTGLPRAIARLCIHRRDSAEKLEN